MHNNAIRIFPIFPKSIPLPPDNLLISPVNNSVVALLKIFGPATLKTVLMIANTMTNPKAIL